MGADSVAMEDALRDALADAWVPADAALVLPEVWTATADAGWFALDGPDGASHLIDAQRALGRQACPLPVAEAFVARAFLPTEILARVESGRVRLAVAFLEDDWFGAHTTVQIPLAEIADHVLVVGREQAALARIRFVVLEPGIARPDRGTVLLDDPVWSSAMPTATTERARCVLRLGYAARAAAGAAELHRLAIEHVVVRRQFGKPVGSFGAVQQRTATCQIDVAGMDLLLDSAAEALDAGAAAGDLRAEIAIEHVCAAARRVVLGAHHSLGAVGYFEEHVGPWIFRQVHADVVGARAIMPSAGTLADRLIDAREELPPVATDTVSEGFRVEVSALVADLRGPAGQDDFDRDDAVRALAARGWLGFGWPIEAGGRDATVGEQVVLNEELTYHRLPVEIELASVLLLGGAILRHGNADQRDRFIPLIREGRMAFCLGYSEPETGSDLASLRTRADRDADGWVVNGQKIWTTRADQADYIWLAARTDPDATPRHAGITVFLVPMSTPGIDVRPILSLSGERAAIVHLDGVVVPDSARVGEINGGWRVITDALVGERVMMGGVAASIKRVLDDVLKTVREQPLLVGPRGSAARAALSSRAAELQALRSLVRHAVEADGLDNLLASPMAGVLGGELAESFAESLVDIFGPAALDTGPSVLAAGGIEQLLRQSVMYVIGGGTNDIQRGVIARALGLPR